MNVSFKRGGNGGDVIVVVDDEEVRISSFVWCSIIAEMSYYGESDYGWFRAWAFHGNRPHNPRTEPLVDKPIPRNF